MVAAAAIATAATTRVAAAVAAATREGGKWGIATIIFLSLSLYPSLPILGRGYVPDQGSILE